LAELDLETFALGRLSLGRRVADDGLHRVVHGMKCQDQRIGFFPGHGSVARTVGAPIRRPLLGDNGRGAVVSQATRDLLVLVAGEIESRWAVGARRMKNEEGRQRLAIRAVQVAGVSHDERCLGRSRGNLNQAERPRSFRIKVAGAGEALFLLVVDDRVAQGRAWLTGGFAVKEVAFTKFFLGLADLFIAIKRAARNKERNYNQ
jgi:hypothetical protein